jgi:hypothetical protein
MVAMVSECVRVARARYGTAVIYSHTLLQIGHFALSCGFHGGMAASCTGFTPSPSACLLFSTSL